MKQSEIQQKIADLESGIEKLKNNLKETSEQFLSDILCSGLTVKIDKEKYPNSVFYFKDKDCLLELEKRDNQIVLWVSYSKIWNPILVKFDLGYAEIQSLCKMTVEEHFNCKVDTANRFDGAFGNRVEEHFNCKVDTAMATFIL